MCGFVERRVRCAAVFLLFGLVLGTGTAQEEINIQFQTWFYTDPVRGANIDQDIAEFEERYPNVNIEPLAITNETYWNRLTLDITSNTEACIVALDTGAGMNAYNNLRPGGAFLPLNDYIEGYTLDDGTVLSEDILLMETVERDGSIIALPYNWFTASATAYRPSVLEEAGVDPAQLETWEGFKEAAEALTVDKDGDGTVDQYGFAHPSYTEVLSRWWHMHWLWTAGGGIFPNEAPPYTAENIIFDSPENLRALAYLVDLVRTSTPPGDNQLLQLLQRFYNGELATAQIALWTLSNLEQDMQPEGSYENDLALAPFPALVEDGVRHEPVFTAWGNPLAISSNCQYPQEAFAFIAHLHSEESQKRNSVATAPVNERVLEWYEENYPQQAQFVDMARNYEWRLVPDIPQWNQFDTIIQQAFNSALLGVRTPEEALAWGQQQMERALAR